MSICAARWWVCSRGTKGLGKVWNGIWWREECGVMNERTKTAAWAHWVEVTTGRGENKTRGGRHKSVSWIKSYLLVINVWERQDGANTPLEKKNTNLIRYILLSVVNLCVHFFSLVGTYVTSLSEVFSSLPRFCMYCHCSTDRLWPPR